MKRFEKIKRMLGIDKPNAYFGGYVQRTNAILAWYSGIAVALIQLTLFINTMMQKGAFDAATNRMNRAHAITHLVFGLISLALSYFGRRAVKTGRVHAMVKPIVCYIFIAAAYGIFNSYIDSLHGEPPLTFIFCMVASTCVFVIPPAGSFNINTAAFVVFSKLAHISEIFAHNTVFHYWIGWMIVTLVAILRYQECRYGAAYEEALRDASELDELTGLKNRRSLRQDFQRFVDSDLHVAMCDLDDFKGINDAYGHVVGDQVLRAFAEAILAEFDAEGCYRYGGDEFLVFCADLSNDEFQDRIASMRVLFEERMRRVGEFGELPTTSVGYAHGHAGGEADLRSMVHLADANLYAVKREGKGGMQGESFMGAGARADAVAG